MKKHETHKVNSHNQIERLTIKELAPYLPYDLDVILGSTVRNLTAISLDSPFVFVTYYKGSREKQMAPIENIKPILKPLSTIDLKWFQDNIDEALEDFRINCEPENNHFSVEVCDKILGWSALSLEEYQLFYKGHVDIHGLIDRGLALPIDGNEVKP